MCDCPSESSPEKLVLLSATVTDISTHAVITMEVTRLHNSHPHVITGLKFCSNEYNFKDLPLVRDDMQGSKLRLTGCQC